jgi:SAM-dependent methyltransferase
MARDVASFSPRELKEIRRTRRHPRPTQFDYLHIRHLVRDLSAVLGGLKHPAQDVLDLFCGARPYDDLLPPAARVVGLDIEGNPYGVADVVTDDFLPFPDQSFDLVLCTQAFDYVTDPRKGVAEIRRVLRPGRTVVITVPLVWEYERDLLVHRFTGPELAALFEGWRDVEVVESGGRAVSWATLTGSIVSMAEWHVPHAHRLRSVLRPAFGGAYLVINGIGVVLDRVERRYARSSLTLPMNILVTARRSDPDDA